jgi:hypothetical protein
MRKRNNDNNGKRDRGLSRGRFVNLEPANNRS